MLKYKKYLFSIMLAAILLTQTAKASVTDLNGHWSKNIIEFLINENVIKGYSDNTIRPEKNITRAEFFITVNRMFDFSKKTNINFNDITGSEWYADDIKIAVGEGYISGYSDNTIKAENNITRQEAAFIIQKILNIPDDKEGLNKFSDKDTIDAWSKGAIGATAKNDIINGYSDGKFYPKKNITRAEAFTMIKKAYDFKNDNLKFLESEKYELPKTVSSQNEWKKAVNYAVDNMHDSITLEIENFNESEYDLKNLNIINVSIEAIGSIQGTTASVTYSFKYNENFKMLRAVENEKYISKLTPEEKKTLDDIKKITLDITKDNVTDYDKEKAIHDYIITNFQYDYKNAVKDSLPKSSYSVSGLLESKKGTCLSYASLFQIMALISGLECKMISGSLSDDTKHTWSIIKLDGEYYHIDVTSDDPVPDKENFINYAYFNVTDDEISKTHSWDKNFVPECNGRKYNYYIYNNLVVTNNQELENIILEGIKNKKNQIAFYTENFSINSSSELEFSLINTGVSKFYISGNLGSPGAFVYTPIYD